MAEVNMNLTFGFKIDTPSPAYWGARAINQAGMPDILLDRQDIVGDDVARKSLAEVLNAGALRLACEKHKQMWLREEVPEGIYTLYEDWIVQIQARTCGDYIYLGACFTDQAVRGFEAVRSGNLVFNLRDLTEDKENTHLVWSADRVPEIGERVHSNDWICADTDGAQRVIAYADSGSHLHLITSVFYPSAAWKKQKQNQEARDGVVSYPNLMGREWHDPETKKEPA